MAKASEQMEKALKVSECVPEVGTELHRERLLSKLLDEAVVDGDPQTILLFKGLVRAAGEEDDGEAGTLGECATSGEATAWLQQNWKKGSMLADQICHNIAPAPGLGGSKPKAVSIDTQPQDPAAASGDGQIFGAYGLSARNHIELEIITTAPWSAKLSTFAWRLVAGVLPVGKATGRKMAPEFDALDDTCMLCDSQGAGDTIEHVFGCCGTLQPLRD